MNELLADAGELKKRVVRALEDEIEAGNIRVIMWLADKLKILQEVEPARHESIDELLGRLTPEDLEEYQKLGE